MAQAASRVERKILSEPHVAGRRISVFQRYDLLECAGGQPDAVADLYDLDLADVYHALAYYDDHPREMDAVRGQRKSAFETFQQRRGVEK